jgi:glycyl-tRNA synthetase beta chain
MDFIKDRFVVYLRDTHNLRPDIIHAVLAAQPHFGDLVAHKKAIEQTQAFLASNPNAPALVAGYKRAVNILTIEEKKDQRRYDGAVDAAVLKEPAERALAAALENVTTQLTTASDYTAMLEQLATLRPAIDAFFTDVLVNSEDKAVRENRLFILNAFRALVQRVADFGGVEG